MSWQTTNRSNTVYRLKLSNHIPPWSPKKQPNFSITNFISPQLPRPKAQTELRQSKSTYSRPCRNWSSLPPPGVYKVKRFERVSTRVSHNFMKIWMEGSRRWISCSRIYLCRVIGREIKLRKLWVIFIITSFRKDVPERRMWVLPCYRSWHSGIGK